MHPQNGCANYTSLANLQSTYTTQLAEWTARYGTVPAPTTSRYHCIVWSDWASQPKAELASGIRLDTNYYYYPGSWVANRPGFMTGSGMPMRFTDTDGSLIDVYQAATQMTDESEQSYPFTPDTLLDRALGPQGYYGAFTANLHTDIATTFEDTQTLASAQERGVPVIAARQLLTWLDGRNASSFGALAWSGSTMSFTVNVGAGANQLTAMLPTSGPGGRTLSTLSRGGNAVTFTRTTIKGQEYAVFAAGAGGYQATYAAPGGGAFALTPAETETSAREATVSWSSGQPSTSTVLLGTDPDVLSTRSTVADRTGKHAVTVPGLAPGRTYYFRVRSVAADGRTAVWPPAGRAPARLRTDGIDRRAPRVTGVRAFSLPDGTARVTWTTSERSDSTVRFGRESGRLTGLRLDAGLTRSHAVVLTGLAAGRSYSFRVGSTDAGGNRALSGVRGLRTLGTGVAMQTIQDFRTGTASSRLRLDPSGFGGLTMASAGRATYTSRVLDSGQKVTWGRAVLRGSVPAGASARVQIRSGSTASPDRTWSTWTGMRGDGERVARGGRCLQFRVVLTATGDSLPRVTAVGFTHSGRPLGADEH